MNTDILKTITRYLLVSFLLLFQYLIGMSQSGWASLHGSCAAISYTGGLVFYRQLCSEISVNEGVEQSYLTIDTINDDGCAFQAYDNFGIEYGDTLDAGEYQQRQYFRNAEYNYDHIVCHHLTVHPQTITEDTLLLFSDALGTLSPGLQHDTLTSVFGCDSIVKRMVFAVECADNYTDTAAYGVENVSLHLASPQILPTDFPVQITHDAPSDFTVGTTRRVTWLMVVGHDSLRCGQDVIVHFPPCGGDFVAIDGDSNVYSTIRIGANCWTKENLKSTHYANGIDTIPVSDIFISEGYADTTQNLLTYGRLYSWYSAVNVPEDSTASPTPDMNGWIQGICPTGWHMPSFSDISYLGTLPVSSLRKVGGYWLSSSDDHSGFSAVPGGKIVAAYHAGEHFHLATHIWSVEEHSAHSATACSICDYCPGFSLDDFSKADACSVRCIKN